VLDHVGEIARVKTVPVVHARDGAPRAISRTDFRRITR
jgi:hypothetical protein